MSNNSEKVDSGKNIAILIYILQFAFFLTGGISFLLAGLIAFAKKNDYQNNTFMESHIEYQIQTFIYGVFGIIGFIVIVAMKSPSVVVVADIILYSIIFLYRSIKGIYYLSENKSIGAFYNSDTKKSTQFATKTKVNHIDDSSEEHLRIGKANDKWGYIDQNGECVIEPKFDEAYSFNEGLALVKVNGKYGSINKSGKFVIEPKFEYLVTANGKWYTKDDKGNTVTIDIINQ